MNAAEHIVESYFRLCRGCFTFPDRKVVRGNNRQLDILAYDLKHRLQFHIEVGVTHRLTWCSTREELRAEFQKKFLGAPPEPVSSGGGATDFERGKSYFSQIEETYIEAGFSPADVNLKVDRLAKEPFMNIWRMKLRAGNYGDDMWPLCRERGVATMTHPPIFNTDLTDLNKEDVDPEVKTAARSSIYRFAWDIMGGDVILVGDSVSKTMIARGYVTSAPGKRAYRYNRRNPMTEPSNPEVPWRHEVHVAWDSDFVPFRYRDGAPRITVMHFDPGWAQNILEHQVVTVAIASETKNEETSSLDEAAYSRETQASQRNILRLHAALSNRLRRWLRKRFGVRAEQERNRVDLTFSHKGLKHLAELKVCYGAKTKSAIREALGQLFEYNHYPPRSAAESWWLVLDHKPVVTDVEYIALLREKYHLPLSLAWSKEESFEVYPRFPES